MFRRVVVALTLAGIAGVVLSGCSVFHRDKNSTVSVFDIKPGQCFQAPKAVKAELTRLAVLPCSKPHTQESYAIVKYEAPAGTDASVFPGVEALNNFAQAACAQHFTEYVGVSYLDSSLFFTYLLPSARGWQQDQDRNVICFVTTSGAPLTASVKGSKR